MSLAAAARLGDPLAHGSAMKGLLLGALVGAALAVAVVATGGAALVVAAGAVGAICAGAALGEALGSMSFGGRPAGTLAGSPGSPDVRINGRPAVRAHADQGACKDHGPQRVAQGSDSVFVNALPAARQGDRLTCSATIAAGSSDVRFGGGTRTTDEIDPEVPDWVHWTLGVAGLASAVVLSGGVVLPLTGLLGGLAGAEGGGWIGRRLGGADSDAEKWGQLLGGLVGGLMGWKGGKSLLARSPRLARTDARLAQAARQLSCRTFGGDPVDVVSGEVLLQQQDFELPAALPLVLQRVHLSGSQAGRLFGPAWFSSWDERLEFSAAGVRYRGADGVPIDFDWPGVAGMATGLRAPDWTLLRLPHGFVVSGAGRNAFFAATAAPHARLTSMIDAQGQRIDWHYAADGALVEVRHHGGYRLLVSTQEGRVREIRIDDAAAGASAVLARYGYAQGQLDSVATAGGEPLRYAYDRAGRLCRWQDRRGTWMAYEYDAAGRCVGTCGIDDIFKERFDHDPARRLTVHTDALGHRTTFHYNERQQVTRVLDALGGVHEWEWDENDRRRLEVDPLGRVTRYAYDDEGRLTGVDRPDDAHVGYRYDAAGLCDEITDPAGARWAFRHDSSGRLAEMRLPTGGAVLFEHDASGRSLRRVDPDGQSTVLTTDARGLVTSWRTGSGVTTRLAHDAQGRIRACQDDAGRSLSLAYSAAGRLSEAVTGIGSRERWNHDAEGVLAAHVDALGRTTRHETGWFDTPAAVVQPDGSRIACRHDALLRLQSVSDALGQAWRFERDALGRVVAEVDGSGRRTAYRFDPRGQRTTVCVDGGSPIHHEHDAMDRLVRRVSADAVTSFGYDRCGRLATAGNAEVQVSLARDALGNVVTESTGSHRIESSHDAAGRRVRRRVLALPAAATPAAALPADTAGGDPSLPAERVLSDSRWEHDRAGRPTGLHRAADAWQRVHDADGREVERSWSTAGRTLRMVLGHDLHGRLTRQRVSVRHGREERLVQDRLWTYDAAGQLQSQADATFGRTDYRVDARGRVTTVSGPRGEERYAYDAAGRIVAAAHARPLLAAGLREAGALGERRYRGSELLSAGDVSYVHDALGRVVERRIGRGRAWRLEWTHEHRLRALTTPAGEHWRYTYDALGRRVAKERVEPRPAAAGVAGTGSAERVLEDVRFVWDGDVPACAIATQRSLARDGTERLDQRLVRTTTWEWLPDSFVPLLQEVEVTRGGSPVSHQRYAILADALGTPRELVAADGRIAWQASLTLWGELDELRVADVDCPLGFQGQHRDAESGLAYNRHRYYDPVTARYLSPDPVGITGGLDPHAYVSNPTGWTDPLGLMACPRGGWNGVAIVRQYQNTDVNHRIFSIEIAHGETSQHKALVYLGTWEVVEGQEVRSTFSGVRQIHAAIPLPDPQRGIAYLQAGVPSDRSTSWGYVVGALKAAGVEIPPGRGPAFLRDLGFNLRQFSELDPDRPPGLWSEFDPFRRAGSDGAANGLLDDNAPFTGPTPESTDN